MVTDGGASYAAKKDVPANTALTNTEYWQKLVETGAGVEIGDTATYASTELLFNPEETNEHTVPEVNDNSVSEGDTWSSSKINGELSDLKNVVKDSSFADTGYVYDVSKISNNSEITETGGTRSRTGAARTNYLNGTVIARAFSVDAPGFCFCIAYYSGITQGSFLSYDGSYYPCDGSLHYVGEDRRFRLCFYHDPADTVEFTSEELETIAAGVKTYDYTKTELAEATNAAGANILPMTAFFYTTSGDVGTEVDMAPVESTNTQSVVADCSPGDTFTVSGFGTDSARLYTFLDGENKIVENAPPFAWCLNRVIKAPAGAAKVIIQNNKSTGVPFMTQYRGANASAVNVGAAHTGYSYTPPIYWRNEGIDGTGFIDANTNKRSDGIMFNPGERLIITNTNKDVRAAVYAVSGSEFDLVGFAGYVDGGYRAEFRDWTRAYFIRLAPYSGTTRPNPASGGYISAEIVMDADPYTQGNYKHAAYPQIGLHRVYSNIKPILTFEKKTITESGIEDSEDTCLVTLPNCGWVEVRQDGQSVKFKIAKVTDGVITFPVADWSYYFHRYEGDGESQYYALVTASPGATDQMDIMKRAKLYFGAYLYTDEGATYDFGYYLSGKKLAFIGDSITQGVYDKDIGSDRTLDTTATKTFGETVAEIAGFDNAGLFGIGGACVSNTVGQTWKSLLTNCPKVTGYDVVFVCGGTNDYGNSATEANFRTDYAAVLDTLAVNNTEVICCTPIYRTSKKGPNNQSLWLADYASMIKDIAAEKGLKCIDLLSLTSDGLMTRFCPDGLHPNEMGHKVIADWIAKECDRLGL